MTMYHVVLSRGSHIQEFDVKTVHYSRALMAAANEGFLVKRTEFAEMPEYIMVDYKVSTPKRTVSEGDMTLLFSGEREGWLLFDPRGNNG